MYLELAALEPSSPHPYVGLGTSALGEHDYEGATVAYRKAIDKDPKLRLQLARPAPGAAHGAGPAAGGAGADRCDVAGR